MNDKEIKDLIANRMFSNVSINDIEFELEAHHRNDDITHEQYQGAIDYLLDKNIDEELKL